MGWGLRGLKLRMMGIFSRREGGREGWEDVGWLEWAVWFWVLHTLHTLLI